MRATVAAGLAALALSVTALPASAETLRPPGASVVPTSPTAAPSDGTATADPPAPRAGAVSGPRVVVVGDIACNPVSSTTRTRCRDAATARLATRINPKRVIAVGDLQYEKGELANFQQAYDATWGALKRITRPVPGNHEYKTSGAAGFYSYFGLTQGYRSIRVGTWRIYLLDSNCSDPSVNCAEERAWLRQAMTAHPTTCSAIAMHFPRYSSGEHGSNTSVTRFWRIAQRHGADVALAGHDHDYERFARMNPYGKVRKYGLRSFVVGTGGKSLYSRKSSAPGSQYFRADKFGVLVMTLGDGRYSWKFRALGGTVRDAGSARCR